MNTPEDSTALRCSAWLGRVEQLRESWAERARWLESMSVCSPGLFGDSQRLQAAVFRMCIKELGELAADVAERPNDPDQR